MHFEVDVRYTPVQLVLTLRQRLNVFPRFCGRSCYTKSLHSGRALWRVENLTVAGYRVLQEERLQSIEPP